MLKQKLLALSEKIKKYKHSVHNEANTINVFVDEFFKLLGFDRGNPTQVEAENSADVATKIGKKVDFALKKNNEIIMLVECKTCQISLEKKHLDQLCAYFHTIDAKFSILTNGIVYQFFSDFNRINVMDLEPFLTIDVSNLDDIHNEYYIEVLNKFTYENFDTNSIYNYLIECKEYQAIKNQLENELKNPSNELIKFLTRHLNAKKSASEYKNIVLKVINEVFSLQNQPISIADLSIEEPFDEQSCENKIYFGQINDKEFFKFTKPILLNMDTQQFNTNNSWKELLIIICQYFWQKFNSKKYNC